MRTGLRVDPESEIGQCGKRLLQAAADYWDSYQKHATAGTAVVWLQSENGAMVVFTRGEYKDVLMRNMESLNHKGPLSPDMFYEGEVEAEEGGNP